MSLPAAAIPGQAVSSAQLHRPKSAKVERDKEREISTVKLYTRLINGERGGYLGYTMWRYLKLAHGYTAAHRDGIVKYTAHELRHDCASLLIASGANHASPASTSKRTKREHGEVEDQAASCDLSPLSE